MSAYRRGRAQVVALVVAVLGTCAGLSTGPAWSFWTGAGAGTGSAATDTLPPPTAVTAAVLGGSTSVTVSWTASSAAPAGIDGYYVERRATGSTTSVAACASSPTTLLPAAATSCSDAGVANGEYSYTVTAVHGSWTAAADAAAPTQVDVVRFTLGSVSSVAAGTGFDLTATAQDASGAVLPSYAGTVRFTSSDPNAPVLPADYTFTPADAGAHTFTSGAELHTGPSQTVSVTEVGQATRTGTRTVTVTPGPAAALAFTQQPGGGTGGTIWAVQPKVAVKDAYGNTVTSGSGSTATVAMTIASGTSGAVLTCASRAAVAGVATFSSCKIDKAGTYVLTASSAGLTSASSASFTVGVGTASKLSFTTAPSATVAGSTISPAVAVAVQDAGGNTVTSSNATVALTFGTNTTGATLSGTTSVAAVNGVATFSDLSVNKSGSYTLKATAGSLTVTSASFAVSAGTATQLVITQEPGGGTGGTAWATQPKVTVQDALGNTVTSSTAPVTLTITSGTTGAALTCTNNPRTAASGVATFAACKIDKAGTYVLTASSGSLTSDTSASFSVAVGAATKVVYSTQPSAVVAGATISPAVVVTVQDAGGNTVTTSSATVSLAIGTNPASGTLSGTTAVSVVNGVATFSDLSINRSSTTAYTLVASSTGLTSATSSTFVVSPGPATQLGFTVEPGGGTGGTAWITQPTVAVQDSLGNTVTSSTATIALTIASGTTGATLTCTATSKAATSGVAAFSSCKIDKAGSYVLNATSSGLTTDSSASFTVAVGAATKLIITTQPSATVAGATISPAVVVTVQDAGGNTVTSSAATVAMAFGSNAAGGTLSGTTSVAVVNGVATFPDLSVNKTGSYTLVSSSTGLTSATSGSFAISTGPAAQLSWTTQPGGGTAGAVWAAQPKITVQDSQGNTVTTSTANVTLSVTGGTAGAVLTCTANPKAASAGVATFAGCKIDRAGTYQLTATATGLGAVLSSAFTIS